MSGPSVTRTHFEIQRFQNGEFIGQPIPVASQREAQTEAAYMARGNLLDDKGNREPSTPVYELGDGEEPEQDGYYIRTVTTRTEATVVF